MSTSSEVTASTTTPLPEGVDRLVFRAVQTYSNGEIVRWADPPVEPGGAEPEHPSPVIRLTGGTSTATPTTPAAAAGDGAEDDDGTDPLAIVALVIAGVAIVEATFAVAGARRAP